MRAKYFPLLTIPHSKSKFLEVCMQMKSVFYAFAALGLFSNFIFACGFEPFAAS